MVFVSLAFGGDKMVNVKGFVTGGEVEFALGKSMTVAANVLTGSTTDANSNSITTMRYGVRSYLYSDKAYKDSWYLAPFFDYTTISTLYMMRVGATGGYAWHWDSGFNISWDIGYSYPFGGFIDDLDAAATDSLSSALVGTIKTLLSLEAGIKVGWAF
jgi:hypothetical protein